MRRLRIIIASLACLVVFSAGPMVSAAYNPLDDACRDNTSAAQSTACQGRTEGDPINGNNGVLRRVTLIISFLAGIVAVIIIVIAGLMYIISNGDAQKVSSAKNMLIGALVGLAIIAAAQGILLFVLSRV